MVAGRVVPFLQTQETLAGAHPLDFEFRDPVRVVDLSEAPRYVHLHAASSFYRLDHIQRTGLIFDERISPVFEDGAFTASYLLAEDRPIVAFLGVAEYHYRKRANQDSLTDSAWHHPGKYTDVLEHGHLALLHKAGNPAPSWVQHMIFYDLQWYPKADERMSSATASVSTALSDRFHDLLKEIWSGSTTTRFSSTARQAYLCACASAFSR